MTSIAVLIFAFALLVVGLSLLARAEMRGQARRRAAAAYAEALARMATEMEQLAVRIGEAFTPAVQSATASIVAFGEVLSKIHDDDLADLEALDAANHARDLRDERWDGSWRDRD